MRIWTPIVVGASVCALMACGSDSSGGGGFSSSLPAETPADSLSDEQQVQLCEEYAQYVSNSISPTDIRRMNCTIEALFQEGAETPEACNAYVAQCVAEDEGSGEEPATISTAPIPTSSVSRIVPRRSGRSKIA